LALPDRKIMKLRQLYNSSAPNILAVMAENIPSRAQKVLVIAHNPGLSDLTRQFIANTHPEVQGLHPASIAVFEVAGEWNALKAQAVNLHSIFEAV
jgi:phosphohistidine phosphatase SixA